MNIKNTSVTGQKAYIDQKITIPNVPLEECKRLTEEYNKIRVLEPILSHFVKGIALKLDTDFVGTEFSVKTASSTVDKLERNAKIYEKTFQTMEGYDFSKTMDSFLDMIRYTEICNHDDMMYTAKQTVDYLSSIGFVLGSVNNYYSQPYSSTGYQGLHLNFITPFGQTMELQVHSQESFDAKQKGHKLYEQIRAVSTPEETKKELKKEIMAIHSAVPKPRDYDKFLDIIGIQGITSQAKWALDNIDEIKEQRRQFTNVEFKNQDFDGIEINTFKVSYNGTKILDGFEQVFSDGSIGGYHNFSTFHSNKYFTLTNKNAELTCCVEDVELNREISYDINFLLESTILTEQNHQAWMEKNMPDQEIKENLQSFNRDVQQQDFLTINR